MLSEQVKCDAVIFDLDGTLIEFKFEYMRAKEDIIRKFGLMGLDISEISPHQTIQAILEKAEEKAIENRSRILCEEIRTTSEEVFGKYEIKAARQSELRGDAISTLDTLTERGIKLGLMTNSGREAATINLEKHNLKTYFRSVVTRNEISKLKPDCEGLEKVIHHLGLFAERTVYVGDSVLDIKAAKGANIMSVAIVGGVHSAKILNRENPDYIISGLREVLNIIR